MLHAIELAWDLRSILLFPLSRVEPPMFRASLHPLQRRWPRRSIFGLLVALGWICAVVTGPVAAFEQARYQADHQARQPANLLIAKAQDAQQSGQFVSAIDQLQRAVQGYESAGDRLNQALTLQRLAEAYQSLGQRSAAETAMAKSLKLLEQQPTQTAGASLAQTLTQQGNLQLNSGQAEAALETWKRAQQLYAELGDQTGVIGTQINQAQALQTLGLYRRARLLLEDLQGQIQAQSNPEIKAIGLHSLGVALQATGDLKRSETVLTQSLNLAQANRLETSGILTSLGNSLRARRQIAPALARYAEAAAIATNPQAQLESNLNRLSLLVDSQRQTEAEALVSQIQPQIALQPIGRRSIYATVNYSVSLLKLIDGRSTATSPRQIAEILAQAAQQAKELKDIRAESYALGQLGHLYERTGQLSEAEPLTQKALQLSDSANAPDISYRWQWQLGRIYRQMAQTSTIALTKSVKAPIAPNVDLSKIDLNNADRQKSIVAYQQSVTTLKSIRSDLLASDPEIQFSFRESVEPVYREFADLLIQDKAPEADLKRARLLIEELQLVELENFFRSACLDVQKQQIDQIDSKAAVIYPILLPNRLAIIASLPNRPLHLHTVPLGTAQVEDILEEWLQALNPAYSYRDQLRLSQQVYDWLIRPIEADIKASNLTHLVFVPDGMLRSLPMAALHDGKQYLIEKYSIALTPGLQLLEPRVLLPGQLKALTVGLSEARQGYNALPGVRKEIEQIQTKLPSHVVLNKDFTKLHLRQQVETSNYPIVHLATHGQFSSDPEQTFLLTWDETINVREVQSLLKARATDRSKPIELLVLSACQTATGDKQAALGLAGMAVQSGARSTLATLWAVNDQSTAELMTTLYANLKQTEGQSRGEALRQAQLKLLQSNDYRHPYYWSPFVLIGNWL
jgi:CHAT domain-containing protein